MMQVPRSLWQSRHPQLSLLTSDGISAIKEATRFVVMDLYLLYISVRTTNYEGMGRERVEKG